MGVAHLIPSEMEIKMYEKLYENKEWLTAQFKSGLSARSIGSQLNVSYKLINIWLIKFGLIDDTPEVKKP